MRPLTNSERVLMQVPLNEYWVKRDGLLPKEARALEAGFTGGLDTAAEQVAALTAERDGLRAEVERLQKFAEATAIAALKYDNATYLVKKYPSNGRYQRNLKKIYDQLQEARRLVGDPQPTEF